MIEKFQTVHTFLKEIWFGFNFIAEIEESDGLHLKKNESFLKNFQIGVKKRISTQTRDLEESFSTNINKSKLLQYCPEIEYNKEKIKLLVLDYVDIIINLFLKVNLDSDFILIQNKKLKDSVNFKPDIPLLLKKFILHTLSERIIIKVCTILEKVRELDPKIEFDHQFEESKK